MSKTADFKRLVVAAAIIVVAIALFCLLGGLGLQMLFG
jgi:hypothetical protein